tara:strand:- start:6783 stop:8090 length:1308 start_codon:yes stop_codon:yes gene_type:complete
MLKQSTQQSGPVIRNSILMGTTIITLFFGGFLGWAIFAPLESAAVAPGEVIVEGQRKTVQHLEGGIVSEIFVRDGQRVDEGTVLIKLDDTKARAILALLNGRRTAALSVAARLQAERDGAALISYPVELIKRQNEPQIVDIMRNQTVIFHTRRDSIVGQSAILRQRIAQYNEEIKGIKGQIVAENRQLDLIGEEIKNVRTLFEKGLARKPRLLQLQRRAAEITGSRNMHRAQIARARQSIGESQLRIAELKNQNTKEIMEQLKTTMAEIRDLNERLHASKDVLRRTEIRASISGTVVGLQVHSTKGVVAPGSNLMDLVPNKGRLIVQARIAPKDIDVVQLGQTAQVRMSAFNQRNSAPLPARVISISADRLTDDRTGRDFYRAEVALENQSGPDGQNKLVPGMEAEVLILAGQKSLMQYFFEPISRGFNRAFRES